MQVDAGRPEGTERDVRIEAPLADHGAGNPGGYPQTATLYFCRQDRQLHQVDCFGSEIVKKLRIVPFACAAGLMSRQFASAGTMPT